MTETTYNDILYEAIELTPKSFIRTRNVPIDTSFVLENISELDNKIPLEIRYTGLIFFVMDAEINSGTTIGKQLNTGYEDGTINNGPQVNKDKGEQKIIGLFYIFENDLENPIPLHDTITRYFIYAIKVDESKYSNLNKYLNNTFAKAGSRIYIKNLDINVFCDYDGNWKYLSGIYKVKSKSIFDSIPNNLKQPNITVNIDNKRKIIKSDLTLSDEIINLGKDGSLSDCKENGRFYNVNGYIYYCFGDSVIPVSDKFMVKQNVTLNITEGNVNNIIEHNFNTRYLSVYGIINKHDENVNNDYVNYCFPIQFKYINSNKIEIPSNILIQSIDLCLISKTHLGNG